MNGPYLKFCAFALFLVLFSSSFTAWGQTASVIPAPDKVAELLMTANKLTNPRASGSPFHVIAAFDVRRPDGKVVSGTYEETLKSGRTWRSAVRVGPASLIEVCKDGVLQKEQSEEPMPSGASMVGFDIFPGLTGFKPNDPNWSVSEASLSGVEMLKLDRSVDLRPDFPKPYVAAQYYISPAAGILRVRAGGDETVYYNDFTQRDRFLLPSNLTIAMRDKTKVDTHIASFEELTDVPDTLFSLSGQPGEKSGDCDGSAVSLEAGVIAGYLIKPFAYAFPATARHYERGTVVLRVTIGKDGKVKNIDVESSTWHVFDKSAIDGVQKARFVPFLLNGEPVDFNCKISVDFKIYP